MRLVVDANVLFSFFKKDSATRKIITSFELFELITPSLCVKELHRHEGEIREKAKISDEEFEEGMEDLRLFVDIIPDEEFKDFASKAEKISPDLKDVPYIALVMWSKSKGHETSLWSQESKLDELEKHGVKVYKTGELLELLKLK